MKCASVSRWACRKRRRKNSPCMRVDVLVMASIDIDLALRSNKQRRVDVLRVCQAPILQGVAATPITVMGDAEVEDQAPAARLVS